MNTEQDQTVLGVRICFMALLQESLKSQTDIIVISLLFAPKSRPECKFYHCSALKVIPLCGSEPSVYVIFMKRSIPRIGSNLHKVFKLKGH